MNPLVRFWVLSLSLTVCLAAFGYLTVSFVFPAPELVQAGTERRLVATVLSLAGMGVFVWTALFASSDTREDVPTP